MLVSSCVFGRTDNDLWIRTPDGTDYSLTIPNADNELVFNPEVPNVLLKYCIGLILTRFSDLEISERLDLIECCMRQWNAKKPYWVSSQASPSNDPILQTLSPLLHLVNVRHVIKDEDVDIVIDGDDGYVHYYQEGIEEWDKIDDYLYHHPDWIPMFAYIEMTSMLMQRWGKPFDTGVRVATLDDADRYVTLVLNAIRVDANVFDIFGLEACFVGGLLGQEAPSIGEETPLMV